MTYRGYIQNGAVVLDDPIDLPEGCNVRCELVAIETSQPCSPAGGGGLYADLMEFAGTIKGTPADGSRNHDDYLYGTSYT